MKERIESNESVVSDWSVAVVVGNWVCVFLFARSFSLRRGRRGAPRPRLYVLVVTAAGLVDGMYLDFLSVGAFVLYVKFLNDSPFSLSAVLVSLGARRKV